MENKIIKLDRSTVKYITKRLETTLKPLAEELGLAIDFGNCTFKTANCKLQLKVAVLDGDGKAITEESESFKNNAKLFGLEPDDLGKDYKFACRTVLSALGREAPDWL